GPSFVPGARGMGGAIITPEKLLQVARIETGYEQDERAVCGTIRVASALTNRKRRKSASGRRKPFGAMQACRAAHLHRTNLTKISSLYFLVARLPGLT